MQNVGEQSVELMMTASLSNWHNDKRRQRLLIVFVILFGFLEVIYIVNMNVNKNSSIVNNQQHFDNHRNGTGLMLNMHPESSTQPPVTPPVLNNGTKLITTRPNECPEKICNAKDRPSMGTIKIDRSGSFNVAKEPTSGTNFIHGESVMENLKTRLVSAVQEYGELKQEEAAYFDFDSVDTPGFSVFESVCNKVPLMKETDRQNLGKFNPQKCIPSEFTWSKWNSLLMTKYVCCFNGLSIIGIATNPFCHCSLPLPIHDNQRQSVLDEMMSHVDPYLYSDKIDKAVWHGSGTGHWEYADVYSREFNMSLPYLNREHPRMRIVAFNNSAKNANLLESSFEIVPWNTLLKYKYIVSISGNSYAGLLRPALLSNSCVLRQDSLAQEWYESKLKQWVHFVPVKYDLSDLFKKILWAKEHDNECKHIARRGRVFALKHFSKSSVNLYVHTIINKG